MWDGVNRRISLRAEYPCLITVRRDTHSPLSILTHTKDISGGGVRVIIGERIERMTGVDLEIDLMDTLPTISSKGKIQWVEEIPSERKGKSPHYSLGIQFTSLKDKDRQRIKKIVEHLLGKKS